MLISVAILIGSYIICNTSIPLPSEMEVLQWHEKLKLYYGASKDSIPEDVLLVNVSFDKQLVDYQRHGMPVGQYAITDRQKLFEFLRLAKSADNYRYILLDIIFEKGIASPQDSALFHLISSMDRIVIPAHQDAPLQDNILYAKSALADYTITWLETNFVRFKYIWNGKPTIPLRMYQELDGKNITQHGLLYTSNGWICQNGLTLQLPVRMADDVDEKHDETFMHYNVLQLGADLLAMDSIAPIVNEIKGKIVVIGDFYTDIHDTYAGKMAGSVICLNAYYALKRGDHVIWGVWGLRMVFYLLVAFVYFIMVLFYLNGFSLSALTDRLWLKAIISFSSIGFLYWLLAVLGYMLFDTVYNFWFPVFCFGALETLLYFQSTYKKIKNAKIKNNDAAHDDFDDSHGRKLQSAVSEQPSNKN